MRKATERIYEDLDDVSAILEEFVRDLDKLKEADKIDMNARLKPISKHIEAIDKHVKDLVKVNLQHKEGSRLGVLFKAVLKIVPVDRLDQKLFKEEKPAIHAKYVREYKDERVTFEAR